MTQDTIIYLTREAVYATLLLAGPILGVSLAVGLLISIFQATTQIQEQNLTFVPKIVGILVALVVFGPWMLNLIIAFTTNIFLSIPQMVK